MLLVSTYIFWKVFSFVQKLMQDTDKITYNLEGKVP